MLLPFAGLPWMLAFTIRGLRRGGWRYAALFALTVQLTPFCVHVAAAKLV